MIYILIVMWINGSYSSSTSLAVEFNTKEACQAAAQELHRQQQPYLLVCAAKGKL